MIETVDGITTVVEQLSERVRELEQRVATLENVAVTAVDTSPVRHPEQPVAAPPPAALPPLKRGKPPATWKGFPPVETPAGVFTVLGKAVLGMAGAYLLRAIAESSAAPKLPVLLVAIVYAAVWMIWAVRAYTSSRVSSITYAVTSALILSPMLFESTARFQALSPAFTAMVLAGYVVLTLALAAPHDLELAPWVATAAAVVTSLALIFATHELVPLVLGLLAVGLASEVAGCMGHRLTQRILPALAVDFAIWQLVDVMTLSKVVPDGYHAVAPGTITALCLGLLAIYGGSIGVRGFLRRMPITYFDIQQGLLAFALGTFGALRASNRTMAPVLGALFLALAAVCYWGALSRFAEDQQEGNRRISATWAVALLVAGSWLLLPATLQSLFLCVAAVVTAFLYARTAKFSLGIHASVYLAVATVVSPMPGYLMNTLAGTVAGAPAWGVWVVAAAAVVCYAVGARHAERRTLRRVLWVVPALLAGFAVAALAVSAIVGLAGGSAGLVASRLSVVRTMVGCGVALSLAFVGARWNRVELGWVAYAAVGFGTLKLLLEDLRFGNAASLVVSLLFYGGVLILLPKMMSRGKAEAAS